MTATVKRCGLKAAHAGPHMWTDRAVPSMLGDCQALPPHAVQFGDEHLWKGDSLASFRFCRRCGVNQTSAKAPAPCAGTFDRTLAVTLATEGADCAAYIGQAFDILQPDPDGFFPSPFTVIETERAARPHRDRRRPLLRDEVPVSAGVRHRLPTERHRMSSQIAHYKSVVERIDLLRRAAASRVEIEQIFVDAASWNANAKTRKQGDPPIDPDPDGRLRRAIDGISTMLERELPRSVGRGAMGGVALIAEERQRQVSVEGWTPEHDAKHDCGELADAAMCYATVAGATARGATAEEYTDSEEMMKEIGWPFDFQFWKPSDDPIRNLVKAGALIAAEIDRLKRRAAAEGK